ncbi:GatB/YqeY domain-containing protein [Nigerium sp.]|uniref:GatB/YqeY domain-containing protein n=1 Tax=Nigerium sp. TaxID=2042655 RepID=UPI0032213AE4
MGVLENRLHDDMVAAMKAGDRSTTTTLRMAIGALKNEKVAGKAARDLSEADEIAVLTREVNRRRDSAEAYTAGNRPELAEKETAEAELIGRYLPAPLTEAELDALVAEEVAAAEASAAAKPTMKQMGQIIRAVNGRAQGRAQGGEIAAKVRAALG